MRFIRLKCFRQSSPSPIQIAIWTRFEILIMRLIASVLLHAHAVRARVAPTTQRAGSSQLAA